MLKTTDWIVTIEDVAQNITTVLKNAKKQPLIVTEDGRPSAYVLSVEIFDRMFGQLIQQEESQFSANVTEGERQFSKGEFVTLKAALAAAETKWQAQEAQNG